MNLNTGLITTKSLFFKATYVSAGCPIYPYPHNLEYFDDIPHLLHGTITPSPPPSFIKELREC